MPFERHDLNPPGAAPVPVTANVRFWDLDGDGKLEVVVCDMGHGVVLYGDPLKTPGELREIARIPNPDHSEMVDLDRDGRQDLLIADLGDFLPADHEKGSVVWLRQTAPGVFEKIVLAEKLPRVADARAADFDGDGDLDLLVAAFGWHTVGGTFLFENETTDWSAPRFTGFPVDARPGPIHVPPVDLNGDGRLDFVVLLSQQFERVVVYLNRRRGGFRPVEIFKAPTPVWGHSGLQMADLDGDGDLDVLLSNGDTLDDATVKPYHGIRWLENKGDLEFERHDLAAMAGVHRAQAADLDGDGDQDIAACSFLPDPEGKLGAPRFDRVAGADRAGGLRPAHPRDREDVPRHPGPGRLRRRRRRGHAGGEHDRLHVRQDRHRHRERQLGRSSGRTGRETPVHRLVARIGPGLLRGGRLRADRLGDDPADAVRGPGLLLGHDPLDLLALPGGVLGAARDGSRPPPAARGPSCGRGLSSTTRSRCSTASASRPWSASTRPEAEVDGDVVRPQPPGALEVDEGLVALVLLAQERPQEQLGLEVVRVDRHLVAEGLDRSRPVVLLHQALAPQEAL